MNNQRGPLEEIAGDRFVNRKDELDLFWQWATSIPDRVKGSYALIGLRRTGKTAILHRLFNRLFHEQKQVLPVYISFARYVKRSTPINSYEFAEEYLVAYLRSYLAFRLHNPELLAFKSDLPELRKLIPLLSDKIAQRLIDSYDNALSDPLRTAYGLVHWVIDMPAGIASVYNLPTAMIIDEFQVLTNVYNPDHQTYNNLTGSFQQAAETRWAPLLVSGSSVSMMVEDALGGLLSGRFHPKHLGPLSQEFAYDMIFHLGQRNNTPITEELALAIWELTQGYPYPIECLLNSSSPAVQNLPSLDALQKILVHELTQREGALWDHYDEEYGKYIRELNGEGVTRRILLWAIQQPPEQRIFPNKVADALSIPLTTAIDTLNKLQRADVIERVGTGSYWGPADPMLRRYLEYEHYLNIEQLAPEEATKSLLTEYHKLQGEMNRRVGHLAEIIVGGVMHSFDGRTVTATYFNTPGNITLPKFINLERRGGIIKEGVPKEIDLIAEWRTPNTLTAMGQSGVWLVSVRHRNRAMGESEVRQFLEQTATWLAEKQADKPYDHVTRWYVSKLGFTEAATQLLQAEGIYYSDLAQFNQLAQMFGFLPLTG